ncbi:MAG: TIGR04255 family protein [Chitinophagia bacterium]|nr:TIGR04255 family protein [Chitinophagia bacterium]
MPPYSNKFVTEVACTFQFEEGEVVWDSAYFGQYFDKIKDLGFTTRQERKGFQLKIEGNVSEQLLTSVSEEGTQMVFQDLQRGFAIVLGRAHLSFHIVGTYKNWMSFEQSLLLPFYSLYEELGLYNHIASCNVLYLNKFLIGTSEKLADYFTAVSPKINDIGTPLQYFTQQVYPYTGSNGNLTFKLLCNHLGDEKLEVSLECSCFCANDTEATAPQLAKHTRAPLRALFESSITDKLREIL